MAIRDWGGGGNLSGVFSDLIDIFQSQVEASTQRTIRKAEADQAAQDAETYDQWVNGIIDDDAWVAYMEKRLEETKGDKQEHQQWTETYRKHTQAIEDGRMESAYQDGSITIHELIGHYSERLKGLEANSPEYRETKDHYWNLVDKRDADYIDEQAMILVDKIERGQASYSQLLTFYEGMLGRMRKTSPLVSQVRRQITNIRQIVDGVTGGAGGRGRGRSSGGGSGDDSGAGIPEALALANEKVTEYYRLGNVFVPTGESIVQSVFDMFDVEGTKTDILEAMKADSLYIEQMMERWKEFPEDTKLTTAWGQEIPNTPENRFAVYNQAIANYDFRRELLNATGDWDGAAEVQNAREAFVENYMQHDNGLQLADYWAASRETFNQAINLAAVAPDPEKALRLYQQAGHSFVGAANRITRKNDNAIPEFKFDPETMEEVAFATQFGQFVRDARNMTPEEILTAGSMLLDARPEGFWLTEENITAIVGSTEGPTGSGLAGKAAARDGLAATNALRAGQIVGIEPWVYVARAGQSTPTLVKQSEVANFLGIEDDDWASLTRPFAEKIDNRGSAIIVHRAMEAYEPPKWYRDSRGRWVPYEKVAEIGRDPQQLTEKGYEYVDIPELQGWQTVTDGSGRTWFVDPADGQLYERLPFKAGISGSFDVQDLIGQDGKLRLERLQGAEGFVMGIGPGVDLRLAQRILNEAAASGEIDMELYHRRDVETGKVEFNPMSISDLDGMFWSPADAALQNKRALRKGGALDEKRRQVMVQLATRNENRRIARVREWFDSRNVPVAVQQEALYGSMPYIDESIDRAAQMAGIRLRSEERVRELRREPSMAERLAAPTVSRTATPPVQINAVKSPAKYLEEPALTAPTPTTNPIQQELPKYVKSPVKQPSASGGAKII